MTDIVRPFHVRVNGNRLFRITPLSPFAERDRDGKDYDYVPVDCRDVRSTFESQSIVEARTAASRETLLADSQTRDAIASAYASATKTTLPDEYSIEIL